MRHTLEWGKAVRLLDDTEVVESLSHVFTTHATSRSGIDCVNISEYIQCLNDLHWIHIPGQIAPRAMVSITEAKLTFERCSETRPWMLRNFNSNSLGKGNLDWNFFVKACSIIVNGTGHDPGTLLDDGQLL